MRAGTLIDGKYRVDRVIGMGGMGVVFAATHLKLRESFAIKVLLPDLAQRGDATARFLREARAMAKIRSEHVVRVFDVGTLPDGAPFMVMELLDGTNLSAVVRTGGLGIDVAVDYVLQACDAISEAHALGIVHRDLKPANLFVTWTRDGSPLVKVLDFGVSKLLDGAESEMTNASGVVGSPSYMSPEQMQSARDVDHRADIWALGVVLYELLAREKPFSAPSMPALCMTILNEEPPRLGTKVASLPAELESIVHRCLEKDPSARFASVDDLAAALGPFGSHEHSRVERRTPRIEPLAAEATGSADRTVAIEPHGTSLLGVSTGSGPGVARKRSWTRWVLSCALFVLVAAFFVRRIMMPVAAAPPARSSESSAKIEAAAVPSAPGSVSTSSGAPPASAREEPAVPPTPEQPVKIRHAPRPAPRASSTPTPAPTQAPDPFGVRVKF
jgi:serine/threonine-protein kinase